MSNYLIGAIPYSLQRKFITIKGSETRQNRVDLTQISKKISKNKTRMGSGDLRVACGGCGAKAPPFSALPDRLTRR